MCICPASSPTTGEGADEVADEVASRRRCYKFFKLKPKKAGHSLVRQDPTGFKTTFETSMATEHLRKSHDKFTTRMLRVKQEKIVATSEAVVPAKRLKDLEHKLDATLKPETPKPVATSPAPTPSTSKKTSKSWFTPSPQQITQKRLQKHARQRAKQARFCAYSDCKVTGTMFENPEYREVVQDMDSDFAKMDRHRMPEWVDAEYECARALVSASTDDTRDFHKGNPFAQHQHDCVTLGNGVKYVAVGSQHIAEFQNFTVCQGFRRVKAKVDRKDDESASQQMAEQLSEIADGASMKRSDYNSKIQDFADLAVARMMEFDEEGCLMHNIDKTGASAIGALVRSANKREVNPFPGGVALMASMRAWAKTFIYEGQRSDLHVECEKVDAPKLHITIDKCKTRVAAAKRMLTPMCRMNKGMKRHRDGNPKVATCQVTDSQFRSASEFEAVLNVTGEITTLAQHERACNGGFKIILFDRIENSFDPSIGGIPVIELAIVSSSDKKVPRSQTHRDDLTALGKECFDRAGLETMRRHNMKGCKPTSRDYIAAGCDLRIVGRMVLSDEDMEMCKSHTRDAYNKYRAKYEGHVEKEQENVEDKDEVVFIKGIPISLSNKKKEEAKKSNASTAPDFDDAWDNWMLASAHIKWKERFPKELVEVENEESVDTIDDLLTLNVLKGLYHDLIEDPDDCGFFCLYGYLPRLALCYIGANLASSFCERVNSCAKNIMTHDRTMLSDEHLEKLCYLRMNRDYIYFLKVKHPHIMREWQEKQLAALLAD